MRLERVREVVLEGVDEAGDGGFGGFDGGFVAQLA
jgi:hypothetical protein